MPIYEFRCTECGKITEKISNSSVKEIACPHCGAKAEKAVSLFSGKTDNAGSASGCMPSSGFS